MKLTKKLLPALGMLALSACMMVTSTFAWFSMNEKVTATGMSVTAEGNQVYLQIVNPNATNALDKVFQNGAAQTSSTATVTNEKLLPVYVVNSRVQTEKLGEDGNPVKENGQPVYEYKTYIPYFGDSAADTMKWVTNIGVATNNGAAKTDYTDVTDPNTNNGKYYIKNTFHIRLDPTAGAENAGNPLNVASITTNALPTGEGIDESFKNCLSVLVVSTVKTTGTDKVISEDDQLVSTMGQLWDCENNAFSKVTTTYSTEEGGQQVTKKISADALSGAPFSADTYAVVDIYVFFNGEDSKCTLAALAAAENAGYSVTVQFTVA